MPDESTLTSAQARVLRAARKLSSDGRRVTPHAVGQRCFCSDTWARDRLAELAALAITLEAEAGAYGQAGGLSKGGNCDRDNRVSGGGYPGSDVHDSRHQKKAATSCHESIPAAISSAMTARADKVRRHYG